MKVQTINGLCQHPDSALHLLHPKAGRRTETFICTTEIGDTTGSLNGLQHLVHTHLEYLLDMGPLCVFKECPCGNGGSVDFLAINREGLVFLIEVKRAKDQRAKFDVIFQVLKYHCFPADILHFLASPRLESELKRQLKLTKPNADSVAERVRVNIERRLMNPVVIVDEASYPLIAHAYSLALRDIQGELRVFELNIQRIRLSASTKEVDMVYVRKYRSNDWWIGNECSNNRQPTPYSSLDEKLNEIPDKRIMRIVRRLISEAGITKIKPATNMKCFALVPCYAYFSFDPDGQICAATYSRTAKPENPYRVIAVDVKKNDVPRLVEAGFKRTESRNGANTYYVFELTPAITDKKLCALIKVIQQFNDVKDSA
jgi:hypothetical protein